MNAYNPLAAMKRLEEAGLARPQAEAIASEIGFARAASATGLLKEQMDAAFDRHTIRMSIIMAGMLTLACTIIGTITAALLSH